MTKEAHKNFIEYMDQAQAELSTEFDISNKNIDSDEVVANVSFDIGKGKVDFLYGPPEFHVEFFISVNNEENILTRYDLTKLMSNDDIRSWVIENRPDMSHGDKTKAEIDWFILLLGKLKTQPEFLSLV